MIENVNLKSQVEDQNIMQRTLLVTGGCGFIGSCFVRYWLENYKSDNVIVLDALTYAGNRANLTSVENNPRFSFVHGNICDTALVEKLLHENQVNMLVHFAAESHVDRSISGPDDFIETNIIGTYSLLKAAKKVWIDQGKSFGSLPSTVRFHHISTDEVFGSLEPDDAAFNEMSGYAPNSPYSASKAASDHLVRAFHQTYGLPITISNCSNNYGPFHHPEKLIPLTITNILFNSKLPIYGDGMNVRDWLYVEDHIKGIELVLCKGRVGESYNIGGQQELTNLEVVNQICTAINTSFKKNKSLQEKFPDAIYAIEGRAEELITFVSDRAGHDRRYAIDATKSSNELGFEPKYSFEQGLAKTIDWYFNNHRWWQDIQNFIPK